VIVPIAIADALVLEIASRHRVRAVATWQLINELRQNAVGTELDVDPLPSLHAESDLPEAAD
jgi:hypothetical protein